MQAVILAAGKGSRLQSIATDRSKAMLPILGKPIVERLIEQLIANGIHDLILVISPQDRHIARYFNHESRLTADIRFAYQPQRKGMADALRWAAPLIEGDFVLSACDNLTSPEHIGLMLQSWQEEPRANAILTLMHMPAEALSSTGVVVMQGQQVIRIVEKPSPGQAPSDIASLPLYLFSPAILEYLEEVQPSARGEYELQDAIQMLIDRQGNVNGLLTDQRLTLTNPADLLSINRHYLLSGNETAQIQPHTVGVNTHLITPLYIEQGVQIGSNCIIGPNAYIERDCCIGDGVLVRDSVILRETDIPSGDHVIDQVLS
ncbi:MAG: NTP transferase domain-containing protein [Anaerolineales bacterium]|nr:NTP transferase domain-containing protein [Anaerolineales bacterium]